MGAARSRDHHRRDVLLPLQRAIRGASRHDPARPRGLPPPGAASADLERRLLHGGGAVFPGDPRARDPRGGPARVAGDDPRHRHQRGGHRHGAGGGIRSLGPADDAAGGAPALFHPPAAAAGRAPGGRLRPEAGIPRNGPLQAGQPAEGRRASGRRRGLRPHPLPQRAHLFRRGHRHPGGPRPWAAAAAGGLAAARPCRAEPDLLGLPRSREPARHRRLPPRRERAHRAFPT